MAGTKVPPKAVTKRAAKGRKFALSATNGKKILTMSLKGSTQVRTRHPSSRATAEPPEWSAIAGIPSDREIADRTKSLSKEHARTFESLTANLAERLGSFAAARLWLATPHSGYGMAPIELIVNGRIDAVVKAQQAIWGPDPAYA